MPLVFEPGFRKLGAMLSGWPPIARIVPALLMTAVGLQAQVDTADLKEDIRGMNQRMGEMSLRIDQLEHENSQLTARIESSEKGVSPAQLNAAVADLNAAIQSAVANSKTEILEKVAGQMEKLATQTNAALESLSKQAPRAVSEGSKPDSTPSYSKDGVAYTVQKGDTLGLVAKKTGGKVQDIIDANKLTDPSHILVGQTLFIPGGK